MNSIEEMKKCILCLHIQLPESVMNDVQKKWNNVLKEIERSRKALEWYVAEDTYIRWCSLKGVRRIILEDEGKIAREALKEKDSEAILRNEQNHGKTPVI